MANLKAFALNIAKQIKPDDSIECIAEIIEQQIESVWLARARQVMEPNESKLRAALLKVRSYNEAIILDQINYRPEDHIAVIDAALAAHEEGGGALDWLTDKIEEGKGALVFSMTEEGHIGLFVGDDGPCLGIGGSALEAVGDAASKEPSS